MKIYTFTPIERRVLELLVLGCTDEEIGRATGYPVPSVKYQVACVVSKLRARNRTHAAFKAARLRVLRPSVPINVPEYILAAIRAKGATL